ncbi:MAG: hypothetical protein WBP84_10485, partial [Nitrososphaeraceae archaeon]
GLLSKERNPAVSGSNPDGPAIIKVLLVGSEKYEMRQIGHSISSRKLTRAYGKSPVTNGKYVQIRLIL